MKPATPFQRGALKLLRVLLDEAHTAAGTITIQSGNRQRLIAGSLVCTILDYAEGIYLLLEGVNGSAAFVVLRSAMEAYVDLKNVVNDADYVLVMRASWLKQEERTVRSASGSKGSNPYLSDLANDGSLPQREAEIKEEMARLKSQGVCPLSARKRFERADALDLYEGPYARMSWEVHNNTLEARHLREIDGELQLHYSMPLSDHHAQMILGTLADVVTNSIVAGTSPAGGEERLEELRHHRERWRKYCEEYWSQADAGDVP